MNRNYIKPITSLCLILFLITAFTTTSLAGIEQGSFSSTVTIVKAHAVALASNGQLPFEEKIEEQNQDSVTEAAFLASYQLVLPALTTPKEILNSRYDNRALTGNTPLYLVKRSLLI